MKKQNNNQGIYLNQAIKNILEEIDSLLIKNKILKTLEVNLEDAAGKVSAEEISSKENIPGFRSSVMDGYAIGEISIPQKGDKWKIVGESFPGNPFKKILEKGEAITLSTGSMIPNNCFCVIPQEQVSVELINKNKYIFLKDKASNNSWIREEDDQVSKGEKIVKKGERITSGIMSKLASCGFTHIKVNEMAKLGLLITGDELIKVGSSKKKGEIWESNSFLIKSIAKNLGYEINVTFIQKDNYQDIKNTILKISNFNNVVISIGGISVGKKDFLKDIINEVGEIKFWKLFLKPGKPFAFGLIKKEIPYFGLPGNPVSAATTFIQLVWPALQKIEGINDIEFPLRFKVKINSDIKRKKGRPELIRGKLFADEKGELIAEIANDQSSSKISSISNSNLFIEIPSEIEFCKKGSYQWAQLLKINYL